MCVQDDCGSFRGLDIDAPGYAELGAVVVGAGGKDNAADGGVGKCTGQAGNGVHRDLEGRIVGVRRMGVRSVGVRSVAVIWRVAVAEEELTAVAGHMLGGVQCVYVIVAGLGAGQHGARERRRRH